MSRTLRKLHAALAIFLSLGSARVRAQPDLTRRGPEGVPPAAVVAAQAPRWSPLITGSFFTRYELREGYDDLRPVVTRGRFKEGHALFFRARLGLSTGLLALGHGIEAALCLTPQAAGTLGMQGPSTTVDAQLGLYEGYARVQGKHVRVDAGRYAMLYGDALVIGNNDWNQVGRSFDGVRARIGDRAWLDLFVNVIDEGRPDLRGPSRGDLYFVGAYGALGPLLHESLQLDLYALARLWGRSRLEDASGVERARAGASELTLGTRSKGRLGRFDYRIEAGVQLGTRPGSEVSAPGPVASHEALAGQADLELGLSVAADKLRVALEAVYASGEDALRAGRDSGWLDLFPSGHKWLGLSDVFTQDGSKRTNVASGVAHLTLRPVAALTVQADAHVFARLEAQRVGGARGLAGGELDVSVVYVIAGGLRARALYAVFRPDAALYEHAQPARGPAAPAHYFEAELRYDL